MIAPIIQTGDPVLRETAQEIARDDIAKPWFVELIETMKETMRDAPGVGLAAPQIGESLRVFVIEDDSDYFDEAEPEELEQLDRTRVPFFVMVNPTLTVIDKEPVKHFEGCLSIEGFRAEVERVRAVKVEGWNEKGEPVTVEARGWHARILQHEFDHLNGTLYIDRMDTKTFTTVENLEESEEEEEGEEQPD